MELTRKNKSFVEGDQNGKLRKEEKLAWRFWGQNEDVKSPFVVYWMRTF